MKITIDCPSKTHLMFINYVYRDDNFMMMGCKSIETDMLYDGAEYKLTDEVAFAPKADEIGDCNICRFAGCSECDDCINGSEWVRETEIDDLG